MKKGYFFDEFLHEGIIEADKADVMGGGKVHDRGGRISRDDESDVELSVLEPLGRVVEIEEVGVHIGKLDPRHIEDGRHVAENAGAGGADRDSLALDVHDVLHAAALDGDALHVLRVEGGHKTDIVIFLLEGRHALGCPVGQVVLDEGHFDLMGADEVQVGR